MRKKQHLPPAQTSHMQTLLALNNVAMATQAMPCDTTLRHTLPLLGDAPMAEPHMTHCSQEAWGIDPFESTQQRAQQQKESFNAPITTRQTDTKHSTNTTLKAICNYYGALPCKAFLHRKL